jgi:DNA-binding CsgD family transcriptional regulator
VARRGRVRLQLAKAALAATDLAQARRLCEEARGLGALDDRLKAELDLALAEVAFAEHQHTAALAGAGAVLTDADAAGFADLACDALDLLGRYRLLVTLELGRAEEYLLGALRRADDAGLAVSRVRALFQLACIDMGRLGGRSRLRDALSAADEIGALALSAELKQLQAIAHLTTHELDAASACAEEAVAEARRYRLSELAAVCGGIRATIEAFRGHREEAERQVAEAMAAEHFGPQVRAAQSGSALVLAALAHDDVGAAIERVANTRALLRSASPTILVQPLFLGLFHGLAAVVVAVSGADTLVEGSDWVRMDEMFMQSSFNIAQAIVAGRAGDARRAEALFAIGDTGLRWSPWCRALYRRHAAEAALGDGWGQPAEWLVEAEAQFEGFGNEPLARACRSLRRVAGSTAVRRRPASTEGRYPGLLLTTREADVLSLLAEGLTNKQIADRLYLSARTVEKHVERILAKTGLANRTALAAFASGRKGQSAT